MPATNGRTIRDSAKAPPVLLSQVFFSTSAFCFAFPKVRPLKSPKVSPWRLSLPNDFKSFTQAVVAVNETAGNFAQSFARLVLRIPQCPHRLLCFLVSFQGMFRFCNTRADFVFQFKNYFPRRLLSDAGYFCKIICVRLRNRGAERFHRSHVHHGERRFRADSGNSEQKFKNPQLLFRPESVEVKDVFSNDQMRPKGNRSFGL